MAQPYVIELSDEDEPQRVRVPGYRHGERQVIRVTNAANPVVIAIASREEGTGQSSDAAFSQAGTPVSGTPNAYEFTLRYTDISGVVGEGQTFFFNIWEFDPNDESMEGELRSFGYVPVGPSIYVPRDALFPAQVITATLLPDLAPATDANTASQAFTAGTYTSTAGAVTVTTTYRVNGASVAASAELSAGQTLEVTQRVTDSAGNTRTFSVGPVTVTPSQPLANVAAPTLSGNSNIGTTLVVSAGTWSGSSPRTFTYQWTRNGANIATGTTYTLTAADSGSEIACRVTANDGFTTLSVSTASINASFGGASVTGSIPDQSYTLNSGTKTVNAANAFSNAEGGTWGVSGAGATISTAGLVTIPTDTLRNAVTVSVTYTNSAGVATAAFSVTVASVPAAMTAPTVTAASSTEISFARAIAPASNNSPILSYDARYSTDQSTWTEIAGITNPQAITGLTASTLYYVQTRAVNAIGSGGWSPSGSDTTDAAGVGAPTYDGGFPDLSYQNNISAQTYDVSQHFSNTAGGVWSLVVTPPQGGISIDSTTGVLTIEPLPLPEGVWTLAVTVTTSEGADTASAELTITPDVTGGGTAAAPTYDGQAEDLTLTGGVAMTPADISVHFSGADLSYSATGLPTGLSINSTTGVISGTPGVTGTSNVTVTANNGGTASASFTITVS